MGNPAFAFFATGTLAVGGGMVWGIMMSASGDHSLSAAHGHLNLVGWTTMALIGVYYAMTPAAAGRLAWVHWILATLGLVLMVPGIVMAVTGQGEGLAKAGSVLTLAAMVIFLYTVFRHGFGDNGARAG